MAAWRADKQWKGISEQRAKEENLKEARQSTPASATSSLIDVIAKEESHQSFDNIVSRSNSLGKGRFLCTDYCCGRRRLLQGNRRSNQEKRFSLRQLAGRNQVESIRGRTACLARQSTGQEVTHNSHQRSHGNHHRVSLDSLRNPSR